MKKIIITTFFILHIFCSSILAADWKYFATSASDDVLYYDKESIVYPYEKKMLWGMANVKDNNRLRIWILKKYSDETKRIKERIERQHYNDQAATHYDQYEYVKSERERANDIMRSIGSDPYSATPHEQDSLRKSKEYRGKADAYVAPDKKTYSIIMDCEKERVDYDAISPNSVYRELLKKVCN